MANRCRNNQRFFASVRMTFTRWRLSGWTPNVEHLILRVEYNSRVTPGYRLLLRDVSQTRDAAYLPANHRSETMRSGRNRAEAGERCDLSVRGRLHHSQATNAFPPAILVSTIAGSAVADFR